MYAVETVHFSSTIAHQLYYHVRVGNFVKSLAQLVLDIRMHRRYVISPSSISPSRAILFKEPLPDSFTLFLHLHYNLIQTLQHSILSSAIPSLLQNLLPLSPPPQLYLQISKLTLAPPA